MSSHNANKVVLAYSGGVDTTACIPYLKHEWGVKEVIALTADLGQGTDLEPIRQKGLRAGASVALVVDARERFMREYALPALRANALYDGKYPLISALGRPLIARLLVEAAEQYGADAVAHGATGKGNDQVRFDVSVSILNPKLKVLAPARSWNMSREETIAYAEKFGLPPPVKKSTPYAIDLNVLGRNVEAGPIEDLSVEPPEEVWSLTQSLEKTPDAPEYVEIRFEQGAPVALNGKAGSLLEILTHLNDVAGKHGVGRIDMLENRVVGIKSREIYEAPGLMTLIEAHRDLESLTLPGDLNHFKRGMDDAYARTVFSGLWYSPLKEALEAFIEKSQERVTGTIRMKLFKGHATVVARESKFGLYSYALATYGPGDKWDHQAAEGFIQLFGMASRLWARKGHE